MAKKSSAALKESPKETKPVAQQSNVPVPINPAQPPAPITRRSFLSDDIPLDKITIPRLRIIQAMSESFTVHSRPIGHYENSITKQVYGDKVTLVPIKLAFGALYMKPGKGLVCRSDDGVTSIHGKKCQECPFGVYYDNWGENNKAPECGATINVLCLILPTLEPVVLTFTKTSYKQGKNLASALKLNQELKAFVTVSAKDTNDKGTFFINEVLEWQPITDEQYSAAAAFREKTGKQGYKIDPETNE